VEAGRAQACASGTGLGDTGMSTSSDLLEYTPSQVWSVLVGESEDVDEQVDVRMALSRMPLPEQMFLSLLALGYTATYAMAEAGLKGNSTKLKRGALMQLTDLVNGE